MMFLEEDLQPSTDIPKNWFTGPKDTKKHPSLLNAVFFFLSLLTFFFSVALVRFFVAGVPVRSMFVLLLFTFTLVFKPNLIAAAFQNMWKVFCVIAYAAMLGLVVSLFNKVQIGNILRQLVEIHLQAFFGVLIGYVLLNIIGPKKLMQCFLLIVGMSGVIAVLQAGGLDIAWKMRETLQQYQIYPREFVYLSNRARAMGLSFTPVHLGTQLCIAFAVVYAVNKLDAKNLAKGDFQKQTWVFLIFAICIAIASGNRSPILGFFAFITGYMVHKRPFMTILLAIFLLPFFYFAYLNMQAIIDFFTNTGFRAFSFGDRSAEGRETLRGFGILLFLNRPLGYGLSFASVVHVNEFWSQVAGFANAQTVRMNAVHNGYLNVFLKHGIFILPLAFYVGRALLKRIYLLLAFVPYAVHIYFHNDGPFQGDFLIWFFVPLFIAVGHSKLRDSTEALNSQNERKPDRINVKEITLNSKQNSMI